MEKKNRLNLLYLLIALFLCVLTGFSMRPALADEAGTPSLSAENASAQRGDSVDLDICIANNPGILGATFEVNYDSRLTLTGIANGDAFEKLDMTKPKELTSGCRIHWDTTDIADEDVKDGTVVTLTFSISESAKAGDTCFVRVVGVNNGGQMDVYDRSLNPVNLAPASCLVSVEPDPPVHATSVDLDFASLTLTAKGQTQKLNATVLPDTADNKTVTWSSDDESVVTIDQNGLVTAVANGKTSVSATTNDGGLVARCEVTVDIPVPIVHVVGIELNTSSIEMTAVGEQVPLSAMVRPEEATDRSVQWKTTDASVATVTGDGLVTAVSNGSAEILATTTDGGFVARCSVRVNIPKKKESLAGAVITFGPTSTTYTGSEIKPKVTVALGGKTLSPTTDYTLAYRNNINAGTATVTVTGKGDYIGSKDVAFSIARAVNGMKTKVAKKTVKLAKVRKKKQVVASLKVTGAQGKLTYANVSTAKKVKKLKVNKKTGKITVPKGTKKGTYQVKVSVTAAGDANHKAVTKIVTCKVIVK